MDGVELILMDVDFRRLCVIRAFHALRWSRRYYADGGFELRLPTRYMDDARRAAYVFRKDKAETGRISSLKKDEYEITLRGGFLEELLKTRALDTEAVYEGRAHDVCRAIVSDFCITNGVRAIGGLRLGDYALLERDVSYRQRGKTVHEALRDVLTEREASFRLRYEIEENAVFFDIFKGLDRTASQSENTWCVFSNEYHNVLSEIYEENRDIRNIAYVAGSRRDGGLTTLDSIETLEVDIREAGAQRSELYVDARDVVKTADMSETEFISLLRERGLQKLAEYGGGASAECAVDASKMSNMEFELGDKCLYRSDELGLEAEGRITEIEETIENNEISTNIILGGEQLDLVRILKRN